MHDVLKKTTRTRASKRFNPLEALGKPKTIEREIEDILETEIKSEEKIKIVRYKERETK